MPETDLLRALARGKDSRQQFKRDATNADGMAVAFRWPRISVKNFGRNFGANYGPARPRVGEKWG